MLRHGTKHGSCSYWSLPRPLRKLLKPFHFILSNTHTLYHLFRPELVIYKGNERNKGKKISVAIAGPPETRAWFASLAFLNFPEQYALGRTWVWNVLPVVKKAMPDCRLAVIQTIPVVEKWASIAEAYRLPLWMESILDITPEGREKKRDRYRDIARLVEKNKLSYMMTKEDAHFDLFYYRMYGPYIQSRHGQSAVILPYNQMKELIKNGELMMILMGGKPVGGCLLKREKGQVTFSKVGILNGDFNYVKAGCISSMVYFLGNYLNDKGVMTMSMGMSRPFLRDGPFNFKRHFGARVTDVRMNKTRNLLYLKPLIEDEALGDFLAGNPFICYSRTGVLEPVSFNKKQDTGIRPPNQDSYCET